MVKQIVIILLYAGFLFSEEQMQLYPADFIDRDAFREAVISFLGNKKKIIYNKRNREFMIFADNNQHKQINDIYKKIESDLKMIRVVISKKSSLIENKRGGLKTGAEISLKNREVRSMVNFKYKFTTDKKSLSSDSSQTLLVLTGHDAFIEVGEYSPHEDWFINFGINNGFISRGLRYQFSGSRVLIRPTLLNDGRILLTIVPEYSLLCGDKNNSIRVTSLQSEIIVSEGEVFKLTENEQNNEFYDLFFQSRSPAGTFQKDELWVRAYIVDSK